MKKPVLKTLSAILAFGLTASLFAGCSSKNPGGGAVQTAKPSTTLTVEVFDRGSPNQASLTDNYLTKYVNENFGKKNNVTVQYVPLPRSQENDKLNVLMAGNQAPDVCFTYNDTNIIYSFVMQGGLTDLGPVIDQYGPTLSKYLGKDCLKYGIFNGKQYAIPAKRTSLASVNSFIRKDWLDKLGLPLPKTRDDLYNDLVAFRDKNPGGVQGAIPFVLGGGRYGCANLPESFRPELTEEQLATLPGWQIPGNKEYMKFMNKLYHEKLLSTDFAVDKTGAKADADLSNGKGGFFCSVFDYPYGVNPGICTNLKKSVPDAELVPVDCFQNSQGQYRKSIYGLNGMDIIVPKSSKNAVLAVKYLDWMCDLKVDMFMKYGAEGTNYKLVDGIPQVFTQTKNTIMNNDYCIINNGPEVGDEAKNLQAIANNYPGYENDVKNAYKISVNDGYTPFVWQEPNQAAAKYGQALSDKSNEMNAKLITCDPGQFDKLYDSLVAEFMTAGGQALKDESIKLYKEQTKNQ